jgi:hypothetical protein
MSFEVRFGAQYLIKSGKMSLLAKLTVKLTDGFRAKFLSITPEKVSTVTYQGPILNCQDFEDNSFRKCHFQYLKLITLARDSN